MNNRRRKEDFFNQIYLPLSLLQGFEKVVWGFTVRGCWRPNITEIFWPQTYGRHVVSFLFFWCSTGALGSTLLGADFLYCILSASSLDPNSSGPQALSAWCGFPYHISLHWNSTGSSNSTELYNRSTPTRSLKSNVSSSSSGNNCHAVQRSLSSGASLCSGTVGPSSCPILSALIRPRDLFRLLAIGMCHFLPVHHLGMAFLAGSEGQNITRIYRLMSICLCVHEIECLSEHPKLMRFER